MREVKLLVNLMMRCILSILYIYGIVLTACVILLGWPITFLMLLCLEDFFKAIRKTFPICEEV